MDLVNLTSSEDDDSAKELFPHTTECVRKMSLAGLRNQKHSPCTCPARQGRKNYLYLLRRARRKAYIDAYAKIRHEVRERAEAAKTPLERQVLEELAAWAETMEWAHLEAT